MKPLASELRTNRSPESALLDITDLRVDFPVRRNLLGRPVQWLRAVADASLSVYPGEVVGLVGESGSGKTTIGRAALRLIRPTSGRIDFDGQDITQLSSKALRPLRRSMQIVFQDPFDSLNERMTIAALIGEGLSIHRMGTSTERRQAVGEVMREVGLPAEWAGRYPHSLSGGQRQRVGIARALAVRPRFLVADEPVSALDLSIQAQVLNLLLDIRDRHGLGILFISHDLSVVRFVSDRVLVLYLGRVVESASVEALHDNPVHPYTEALVSAAPQVGGRNGRSRIRLVGDIPSALNPPSGCVFRTRCPIATKDCASQEPPLRQIAPGHAVACWRRP